MSDDGITREEFDALVERVRQLELLNDRRDEYEMEQRERNS